MSFVYCVIKVVYVVMFFFFFSSRRRHTRYWRDWSSDVCSSDLPDRLELVLRLLVREGGLHVGLPDRVLAEGMAGERLAGGVELEQLLRHLPDAVLHARFGAKPVTATQAVEAGGRVVAADVFLDAVQLVAGDEEFVRVLVVDAHELALDAVDRAPHQTPVAADAVVDVDHQVPFAQLAEGDDRTPFLQLAGEARPGPPALLVAEDL